jgi:1,4-alpha-glucan branching enzyme
MKTPSKKSAKKASKKVSTSAGRKRVTFQVSAPASSEVSVAGSFNDWQPQLLTPGSGKGTVKFSRILFLSPGTHQYKFIINGEWLLDPNCQEMVPNEHGSHNSLLQVG